MVIERTGNSDRITRPGAFARRGAFSARARRDPRAPFCCRRRRGLANARQRGGAVRRSIAHDASRHRRAARETARPEPRVADAAARARRAGRTARGDLEEPMRPERSATTAGSAGHPAGARRGRCERIRWTEMGACAPPKVVIRRPGTSRIGARCCASTFAAPEEHGRSPRPGRAAKFAPPLELHRGGVSGARAVGRRHVVRLRGGACRRRRRSHADDAARHLPAMRARLGAGNTATEPKFYPR